MNNQQNWLEWLKNLPDGVKGAIALVIAIVGFIVVFRDNPYLYVTVSGALFLATLLGLCLYIAFAKRSSSIQLAKEPPEGVKLPRYEKKHRVLAYVGIATIPIVVAAILYFPRSRSVVVTGITGRPPPTPFVFSPAQPDETLLIIADFDNRSAGQIGVDPAQRIYNLIAEKLPGSNVKLRVEQYHQPIKDTAEARGVLKAHGATILIWGWFDQIGAEPNIELDEERIKLSNPNSPEFSLATPESFVIRFTQEIPAQAGYTAFFALGMMQYQLGATDVAKEFFSQAIASTQEATTSAVNPWEALMWRGNIYFWGGEYNLAIADLTKSLELHSHREGYHNRGWSHIYLGNYTAALADFNEAVKVDAGYTDAYYGRGVAYRRSGNYAAAIADQTKVIKIDPNYAGAYYSRALAYDAQGKYDLAIADYTKVIEIDPNYNSAYFNRGSAYGTIGEYDKSVADFSIVIEREPQNQYAYFGRGYTYGALGKYDLAIADYTEAIRIDLKYKEAYFSRAAAYGAQGKHDLAIADYTQAIAIDPDYEDAYANRGLVYRLVGNYEAAIRDHDRSIELDRNDAANYVMRGNTYGAQGKYDLAIADYTQAIILDRDFAGYYTGRGNVYADWGKYDEAIADYQKSISLDPAPYTYCVLGITYTKAGDFSSAISALELGVKLDAKSEFPWCKTALDNARLGTPTP